MVDREGRKEMSEGVKEDGERERDGRRWRGRRRKMEVEKLFILYLTRLALSFLPLN